MKREKLTFRKYQFEDAKTIVAWINNEEENYLWCGGRFSYPANCEDFNAICYSLKCVYSPDNFIPLTFICQNEIVGYLVIIIMDRELGEARLCFVIVKKDMRNQGIGKLMISKVRDYALQELHIHKLTLGVFGQNISAIKCYTSIGFRKCEAEQKELEEYEINLEEES